MAGWVLVGIAAWKRDAVAGFLRTDGAPPRFEDEPRRAVEIARREQRQIGVWATREPPGLTDLCAAAGQPLARIEDGFIRSVGLGSDLIPGASIVVDRTGIYFDPTAPSDLETILSSHRFDDALRARAARLRERVVATRLSKYNLQGSKTPAVRRDGRPTILVPGQVEDDLSVRRGGGEIQDNLSLLARVREQRPDARILFKPHPDVEAGHRAGRIPEAAALRFADDYLRAGAPPDLLDAVDEVHTLTSLMGFEAVLRGVPTTVFGQPFYAGWGLTTDQGPPCPRRGRTLTLDELVAGALILYPLYLDPQTREPCPPEQLVEALAARRFWRSGALVMARRAQGRLIRGLARLGLDLRKAP